MKRKLDSEAQESSQASPSPSKKRTLSPPTAVDETDIKSAFQPDLFQSATIISYRTTYAGSTPYPHAVVPQLITTRLLNAVRAEIAAHIHFTPKETDIYRIHQSGDLANLSNLDAESLQRLPNLVRVRDALYSDEFRSWISEVTGAGKVSGSKTDMAVNVYTPGSYLLCHDDVIGSRRVSYILYLTDPDKPWRSGWGGGLRLYPTETRRDRNGEDVKVPLAEHSLNIPPGAGQLSFFAVRPGESYHDVEEVYHPGKADEKEDDGGRIRMAISGWFHIPQEGEDGFEEGLEEAQAQRSSLAQLKGAADEFDEPQMEFRHFDEARRVMDSHARKHEIDPGDRTDRDDDILTEQDLTFLLHYISPSFLTPDLIEQFAQSFEETSVLQLERFFGDKFANELMEYITKVESGEDHPSTRVKEHPAKWSVARPPHKHRYAYLQSIENLHKDKSPIARILADLLHSHAFKKWLALVTGLKTPSLVRQNAIARRFRRGQDYALAHPFKGEQPQLEFTISMTPTTGWEKDDGHVGTHSQSNQQDQRSSSNFVNGTKTNGLQQPNISTAVQVDTATTTNEQPEFGGEEVYMAGDDDEDDEASNAGSMQSKSLPRVGKKADPAIYKSSTVDDEDDGILFTNPATWNQFSVVLRDKGTLRFVKYVSQAAVGDRWDVKGEVELSEDAFDGEDEEDEEEEEEEDDEGFDEDDLGGEDENQDDE